MLYNVDRDRGILLVSGTFYSEEERGHDTFDGPFPVASWDAAQTLMKQYVDDDPDEDWSESFWQIKLYTAEDLHDRPRAQASLIFAATMTGDLVFLSDRRNQRTPHQSIDHLPWNNSKHFCANGEVFYTPWSPATSSRSIVGPSITVPVLPSCSKTTTIVRSKARFGAPTRAKSTALGKAISA